MRYYVTVNFEIIENDNEMAINKAKEFCENQRIEFDNRCQLLTVERLGFAEIESETIYDFQNPV